MRALLIIDMQLGSFRPYELRQDTFAVIDRINRLSDAFRKNRDLVIFIQHDGTKENCFMPGTEEWSLLPELIRGAADIFVSKTANDSFYKTDLQTILRSRGVKELIVTGCATDFCVESTIKSALTRDYSITVVADGHTTADRPMIPARQVIQYFNWLWSEMTPTEGGIKVETCDTILGA
ncbi:cysteine hydrolase [Sphingobacterium multivorum]|uniref:Cysteine hydrolase n=1 Tax=Sphingobacterium multivorum TaxID=28454 RepID=A0ABX7CR16_SPHMU|nr:cysteine hydrolase family protein [Sphingobacterium multivorum]QQT29440.1 cysteine hydrolase [Sphingobacterium multivorum]QQT54540.1 cysteine hydrolase [Sphingobacterium multivorum]